MQYWWWLLLGVEGAVLIGGATGSRGCCTEVFKWHVKVSRPHCLEQHQLNCFPYPPMCDEKAV